MWKNVSCNDKIKICISALIINKLALYPVLGVHIILTFLSASTFTYFHCSAEGNYHTALANNSQLLHASHLHHSSAAGNGVGNTSLVKTPTTAATATLQAFDFGSESCSLRRSRSLAVIREETFSDLQITTANNSRRSQLIPRARIVNRGFIRERER